MMSPETINPHSRLTSLACTISFLPKNVSTALPIVVTVIQPGITYQFQFVDLGETYNDELPNFIFSRIHALRKLLPNVDYKALFPEILTDCLFELVG